MGTRPVRAAVGAGLALAVAAVAVSVLRGPDDGTGTASSADAVARCVHRDRVPLAPEHVGLPEDVAVRTRPSAAATVRDVRVIGRDGACLDRTDDSRPERVNLIVVDRRVVWAGRF